MNGYRVIGKRIPRVDAYDKVTGRSVYGTDLRLKDMLVGKVLRSPYAHARIRRIDTSKAKSLSGVAAVLTARDLPGNRGFNILGDSEILASDRVRFIGNEVALVAAVNEEIAQKALELIEVDYEPLPVITELRKAMAPDTLLIHEDKPNNIAMTYELTRGDIQKAFSEAAVIISDTFSFPKLHQAHLEPNCAIGLYQNNQLIVYCATQVFFILRSRMSKVLGFEEGRIVIRAVESGGAFGAGDGQATPFLAGALALHTRQPVRIVNTREEEFLATRPAMPMEIEISIAADADGHFRGKKSAILADNGAYTCQGHAVMSIAAFRSDNLYRYDAVQVKAQAIYTNKAPVGAYRGYGNPQMHFAVESLIDVLALKLKMDPTEIRLQNFIRKGDTGIQGYRIDSCGLQECMQEAKRLSDWEKKRQQKKKGKGIGVAALIHVAGSRIGAPFGGGSAMIKVDILGTISLQVGEAEIGQGSKMVFAQIAAEELGCHPQDIHVVLGDTDLTPYSWGTYGSKLSTVMGKAVLLAAKDLKKQLLEYAGQLCGRTGIDLRSGWIVDDVHSNVISFSDLARKACEKRNGQPLVGLGACEPESQAPDKTGYGNIAAAYPFGVQIAEVTVAPGGKITVDRVTSVHDVGKAINPMMIEGQVYGGVMQGLGMSLLETLPNDEDGITHNNSFLEYKIPTVHELPEIRAGIVESIDPTGPFGAKGVGEPPIISVAPAVANAIYDAVGVRIRKIPVTPKYFLKEIRKEG